MPFPDGGSVIHPVQVAAVILPVYEQVAWTLVLSRFAVPALRYLQGADAHVENVRAKASGTDGRTCIPPATPSEGHLRPGILPYP